MMVMIVVVVVLTVFPTFIVAFWEENLSMSLLHHARRPEVHPLGYLLSFLESSMKTGSK